MILDDSQANSAPSGAGSAAQTPTLQWALQRLSQLQGGRLDPIALSTALEKSFSLKTPEKQLMAVCQVLKVNRPHFLKTPDRSRLPMLVSHAQHGWSILMNRTPEGQWVLQTPQGSALVSEASLAQRCALVQLGPKLSLGLGLFTNKDQDSSFFAQVRETLRLYRKELLEACVLTPTEN